MVLVYTGIGELRATSSGHFFGRWEVSAMHTWIVEEAGFCPEHLQRYETLFTLGNGYLGTRGSFEERYPSAQPLTLIHGVYDDAPIVHTELANAPNWLALEIRLGDHRFRLDQGEILNFRRRLDLRHGLLTRQVRWRGPDGHTFDVEFERFVSMADPHVMAVRVQVTSADYEGAIAFNAGLDGMVDNDGLRHWHWVDQGGTGEGRWAYLTLATRHTHTTVAEAASLDVVGKSAVEYGFEDCPWYPRLTAVTRIVPGDTVMATKVISVFTSREAEDVTHSALEELQRATGVGYTMLREAHCAVWDALWSRSDVIIEGDDLAQRAIRFSLFHLLIAAPRIDERVSIPAKTLSGLGYRGHVFWDTEIFMLPFFIYTHPETARRMLMYRYHTLDGARRKAASQGYEGAMYAWESAATGDETTPRWVPVWVESSQSDELVRIWCGDIEQHITADVAYAVDRYWKATGDDEFMRDYGAEIVLETARFWASRVSWDEGLGVYEIRDVIGPDENHEHVDNNAYTNAMARWNLRSGVAIMAWLEARFPERADTLRARLGLGPDDPLNWQHIADRIKLNYDEATGLIEQFDGFYTLREVAFDMYEPRTTSLQALLGIEETNRCQVLKQPDVLMLLYLHPELYPKGIVRTNWDYYTPRTDLTYGSSLGPAIQAALAARMDDVEQAQRYFELAARTDLEDARGNTADGIHGATAGGLWQAVVFGFAGVRLTEQGVCVAPCLPPSWRRLAFRLIYHGRTYKVEIGPRSWDVSVVQGVRV